MSHVGESGRTTVLVVDDDVAFADLTATFLGHHEETLDVETATSGQEALDRLGENPSIDCVVSDYDMPGLDGLALLEAVQADHPGLPFILFTGKGSEEIASRAITAGVTDYLQKRGMSEQFDRLANRVVHATRARRAEHDAASTQAYLDTILESVSDVVLTIDARSTIQFANAATEPIFGYTPEELRGESLLVLMPERFHDRHESGIERYLTEGERRLEWTAVEFPGRHRDGHEIPLEISFGEFSRSGERFFTGVIRRRPGEE